jgi:hypothetical protein
MKAAKYETSTGALAAYLGGKPKGAFLCDLYTFTLAGSVQASGNTAAGSATVSGLSTTAGLYVGQKVGGPGIPAGAAVTAIGSGTVTLSAAATATATGVGLNFAAWLPLTYTTADVDVVVPYATGAVTYSSQLVYFDQLSNKAYGHWKVGLDVDTWQVIAAPSPQAVVGTQPWLAALRAGVLDGAIVAVDRAFIDNRAGMRQAPRQLSPLGVVNIFTGRVAEVDLGRSNAVISINSHLELLNVTMPRNLFQAGCRWTLFDAGCTLVAANFAVAGTLAATPGSNPISVTVAAPGGSGTYALGRILMTSGANAGFGRAITSWSPGSPASLTLRAPFPFPLASGDAFLAYPGCDKQENSCIAFNNLPNFGGQPFIPAPETAV